MFALVTRKPTGGDEMTRYFLAGSPREQQLWTTGVEAILTGKAVRRPRRSSDPRPAEIRIALRRGFATPPPEAHLALAPMPWQGRNAELVAAMRDQVSSPREMRRYTLPLSSAQRASGGWHGLHSLCGRGKGGLRASHRSFACGCAHGWPLSQLAQLRSHPPCACARRRPDGDGLPGTPGRGRRSSSASDFGGAIRRASFSMGLLFSSRRGSSESMSSTPGGGGGGGGGGDAEGSGGWSRRGSSRKASRRSDKLSIKSVGSTASLQVCRCTTPAMSPRLDTRPCLRSPPPPSSLTSEPPRGVLCDARGLPPPSPPSPLLPAHARAPLAAVAGVLRGEHLAH